MKSLIVVAAVLAVVSAAPERERRSLLGLGHHGAVVVGGVVPGLALASPGLSLVGHAAPSVAVLGPHAGSAAVIGPHSGSAAVIGPHAGSAAVIGPHGGHAAVIGPSAASAVVAGPAGAVVAPAYGHGHHGLVTVL